MTPRTGRPRGIALLSVLLALVVLWALVAAALVPLLEEGRVSENARFEAAALGAAEAGVIHELEEGDAGEALGGGVSLLDATGRAADSSAAWAGARARIGLLVGGDSLGLPEAALISVGEVSVSGGARVEPDSAGGVAEGVATFSDSGFGSAGNMLFERLAGLKGSGVPLAHITGPGHLGGAGGPTEGVLLVDGDLAIDSGFAFRGLVVTRGALVVSGSSPDCVQLFGTVVTLDHGSVDGCVLIKYSKALIDSILHAENGPKAIPSRPWIRLF